MKQVLTGFIYSSDEGVCKGDSGGPMISFNTTTRQYFLLGVVSGGTDQYCGKRNFPGNKTSHIDLWLITLILGIHQKV